MQLYCALLYNAHIRGFLEGEIYKSSFPTTKGVCVPGFNCYSCPGAVGACPLGALQNALASTGHQAGWYVLGILSLFGVVLGRTICGWLCPLGLIQELLHAIPTPKLKKSRVTRALSLLKYLLLAVFVLAIPLWYGLKEGLPLPAFCKYICPAGTLEGAVGLLANPANADMFPMLGIHFTRKFLLLLAIGLLCVFCYRGFCRFLCPLGAIYGFFNRFHVIGVRIDETRCNGCGSCVRGCGMDVRRVGDHECIHCGKCMEVCAREAISLKAGSRTLRAPGGTERPPRVFGALAVGLLCAALLWFNFLEPSVKARPAASDAAASAGCELGAQLADFTLPTFGGGTFRLADTRGKIVFINLWGTYCTPCIRELPDFEALLEAHEGEIAMLAVHAPMTGDVEPEDFVKARGWDRWLLPFARDDDETVFPLVNGGSALPQTIVLNRRGEVVFNRVGSVTPAMLEALYRQADDSAPAALPDSTPAPAQVYQVLVTDEAGAPVPGVTLQFCSDTACVLGKTGADGIAVFAFDAGSYTVHIQKVPEGYAKDRTEYRAPAEPGLMTVVLKKG